MTYDEKHDMIFGSPINAVEVEHLNNPEVKMRRDKFVKFLVDSQPWSTQACFMIGVYGAAVLIIVFGTGTSQNSELLITPPAPEHFRMIVNQRTSDGFVGTNIDGTRFVTSRFMVDPAAGRMISPGDTLDSWFTSGGILEIADAESSVDYSQREILAFRR